MFYLKVIFNAVIPAVIPVLFFKGFFTAVISATKIFFHQNLLIAKIISFIARFLQPIICL